MPRALKRSLLLLLSVFGLVVNAHGRGVYQEPEAFIAEAFASHPPPPQLLRISEALANEVGDILGHRFSVRSLRYWRQEERTAWILEEIGREQPITTGVIVNGGKIERVKVLIYRETRGFEVRYPYFTDQFNGAQLSSGDELDRSIDGISGATLSVNALKKLARVALRLDKQVQAVTSSSP